MADWFWLFTLSVLFVTVQSLPTGLDDSKKTDQTRPKVKRSQEILMFGDQQNHQATENKAAKNYSPPTDKRTLSNSGLDDTLSEISQQPEPKALPSTYLTDQLPVPQREQSYEYGKVQISENEDERKPWNSALHAGQLNLGKITPNRLSHEDRWKRSEDSTSSTSSPAPATSSTSAPAPVTAGAPSGAAVLAGLVPKTNNFVPAYRSYVPYYQEPRYKRESDIDPETFLALLALYDERRNRDDWRNYGIEEYEPIDDEANMINNDDEDLRGMYPQQHRYFSNDPLLSSELGRARSSYYDQQYPSQQQAQYDASGVQYGTPQYGLPYAQHTSQYYPAEKRFMTRKRSQNYDSYGGARSGYMLNTRNYPTYLHHQVY